MDNTTVVTDDEIKQEVMFIIDNALSELFDICEDRKFCLPNGNIWSYGEVKEYINKNLR